jgi:hypothetical protein
MMLENGIRKDLPMRPKWVKPKPYQTKPHHTTPHTLGIANVIGFSGGVA